MPHLRGDRMAENSIDLVRAAEAEAEQIARDAAQQSAEILNSARREAAELAARAGDAALADAERQVAAAHAASQTALDEALQGLTAEMDALAGKARAAQPKAQQMILDALA